eukprot:CAMPEP_0197185650 /NCGR_PEP_ID=MMETSP1423-20130617/12381_1 /TAXON_ID=476441 /ORGANISM="Pseudo-nitzschia heimii, Strain UNC1101" /LENGTH=375 /DNA_ID=CAMNT_0042636775 /DNA_START=146 /DNA_END=1273 /DNA_ORIENTATION=-
MTPTRVPTIASATTSMAPTTEWNLSPFLTESPTSYFMDDSDEGFSDDFNDWDDNGLWMGMWLCTVVVFILLPFITSKRRRVLCMRGIRERRWINDEEYDEYNSEGRQERLQQQREQTQRHFQTTRTQEDQIRQQYLSILMKNFTITLTDSDIHTGEENDEDNDEASKKSIGRDEREMEPDIENQSHATSMSSAGGLQDITDTQSTFTTNTDTSMPVREKRVDSEDSHDLLAFEFQKNGKVSIPPSGYAVTNEKEQRERTGISSTSRRLVSNGCAICLCHLEAGEEVTWSSNPDCCHIFHKDCIINWYLAVGRKTQRRRIRNNPNMTDEEALDHICKFPINCPCCRQPFCIETPSSDAKCEETDNSTSGDDDDRSI